MGRRVIIGVLVLLLIGAGIYLFLLRSPVEALSRAMAAVTIECDAWAGVTADGCGAWGDRLLTAGPPSRTFTMEDLERVQVSGAPLCLGACRVAYYLGRDLDRPVWNEETDCAGDLPWTAWSQVRPARRRGPTASAAPPCLASSHGRASPPATRRASCPTAARI